MLEQINIWLSDSVDCFALFVTVVAFFFRKVNTFFFRLFIYCLLISVLQLVTTVMAWNYIHNWYVYHLIGWIEIVSTFWIYQALGLSNKWLIAVAVVTCVYVIDSVWTIYHDFNLLEADPDAEVYFVNNLGLALAMLFVVVLGINFLWQVYLKGSVKNISRYPYFYISAGLTLCGAGAFFTYLLSLIIITKEVQDYVFHYSWIIVVVSTFIKFSLILVGLILAKNGR